MEDMTPGDYEEEFLDVLLNIQHAPGPWEERIDADGMVWVYDGLGKPVCYIGDMEDTEGIDHNHAQLIAALPDLLDALRSFWELP